MVIQLMVNPILQYLSFGQLQLLRQLHAFRDRQILIFLEFRFQSLNLSSSKSSSGTFFAIVANQISLILSSCKNKYIRLAIANLSSKIAKFLTKYDINI